MTIRVGLLGTGYWAVHTQGAALAERPDVDFAGVWGRDPAKAEAVLITRLKADPKDVTIRAALAQLYLEEKKYDEARLRFEKAWKHADIQISSSRIL